MPEANDFSYRSQNQNIMHACGHDGHTTMLLGATRYLAETRNFDGSVHFIFQHERGYPSVVNSPDAVERVACAGARVLGRVVSFVSVYPARAPRISLT